MIDRGSLSGALGAYLTGVAVTSAPWLLTTAVLVSLRLLARHASDDFTIIELTTTVVYSLTVVFSAPIDVVLSRYASDRFYDKRLDAIAAPLWRGLAIAVVVFAVVGSAAMLLLRVPWSYAIPGAMLTVVVGAQWLALSVAGGLSSPHVVLSAFAVGAPISVIAALGLGHWLPLGPASYLYGFGLGQLVTLVWLLVGVARVLPESTDETARLLPAFVDYKLLACSAFAYHLSIWADKPILWWLGGGSLAALYTTSAAVAWFSVIPAFGWIYVQVETGFYQRYRSYYTAVEGGAPLPRLRERAETVRSEIGSVMRGAALVQACVTVVAWMAGPLVLDTVGIPAVALPMYRFALLGAALQLLTLLTLLLLYYFDLRLDALKVAVILLLAEVVFTIVGCRLSLSPGLGYAAACAVSSSTGVFLLRRRMSTLVVDTFQSQPYGAR